MSRFHVSHSSHSLFGGLFGHSWLTPFWRLPKIELGTFGDDEITGGRRDDILLGLFGDDTIHGGKGDDRIFGGFGDDVLSGDRGSDRIDGGHGLDTALYAGSVRDYSIKLKHNGDARVTDLSNGDVDRLKKVEVLQFDDATIWLDGRNNGPVAFDDTGATDEDSVLALSAASLLANDYDFEGDTLSLVSVSATSAAGATVTFDGTDVSYDPADLFDHLAEGETAEDTFTYTVTDGEGGFDTATVTVTITGRADPVLLVKPAVDYAETSTGTVLVALAAASEGTAAYSISGDDAALFAIDAQTGVLTFLVQPDFEAPQDANGDNLYDLTITLTDDADSDSADVQVTVTDQEEAPAPEVLAAQSFEDETPAGQYVDTGDPSVDHDLVNNAGQSPVDSTGGGLGFDASYVNTRDDVGLTDGDFVGVTDFTGEVGSFTDGVQGYEMQDADGLMRLTFDAVDVSAYDTVEISIDWFLQVTGWESDDLVRIYVETDAGDVTILDTTGADIDDLGIEGGWRTGTAILADAATTARLIVELDSNAATESLYFDNVLVTGSTGGGTRETILTQSFETEATGAQYVDTGDASVDHDLVNNAGQSAVDSTAASAGLLGFDASYVNTRDSVGLTDGDFVGVTGFTGDVGSFTDGSQGYEMQDADGLMRLTFDAVDISAYDGVEVSIDWFLLETGWEADDVARIYVATDVGDVDILDTTGSDIDDLGVEGAWTTGIATLADGATTAQLIVELDSNAATEALYFDNIVVSGITGGGGTRETILTQSFETEAPGSIYVDTGDASVDHDLVNNTGQSVVDSTSASAGLLGFDASYMNTRDDVGLTDGDFVGVTDFTGDVGSFSDGSQGYQMQDADGLMRVTFDAVDISAYDGVEVSLDWFLVETGWEANDLARIYVATDAGDVNIFDSTGLDIDDLGVEGAWTTGTAVLSDAATTAQLIVELDSNSASESLYFDNVAITGVEGTPPSGTSYAIAADAAETLEGDSGTTDFTFTVSRSGDVSAEGSVCWALTSTEADRADFGGALQAGEVTFAAGETEATITVAVSGDTLAEGDEAFEVHIYNPSDGGAVTTSTAGGTILNDDAAVLTISQVQGAGDASGRVGQLVTLTAIVTGDFQDGDADASRNLSGFFLQEELADQDGDAATSEGIRIFESAMLTDVNVGDRVTVTGYVSEFNGETQITAQSVNVDQAGAVADITTLAQAVSLGATDGVVTDDAGAYAPDMEAYEGMLVTFTDKLVVSEMFQLDRYNEIRVSVDERPEQYTQFAEPDVDGYDAYLRDEGADRIVYDDGQNVQNAPIFEEADLDEDGDFDSDDGFTMGDSMTGLTGIVTWDDAGPFSEETWRIRSPLDDLNNFEDTGVRDATPPDVGGTITVSSFNVLNFFTTLVGEGTSGPSDLEPRGANDLAEYERQLDKLVTTLSAIDADVFGLVELENEFQGDQNGDGAWAINAVVEALNAGYGAGTWAAVDPGRAYVDTSDAISVGMIYKTTKVSVDFGSVEILDDSDLAGLGGDYGSGPVFDGPSTNRAPLAATFTDLASGEDFTVAVAHMKSKGDSTGDAVGGDADMGDGAGAYNETRTEGVKALTDWLDSFADEDRLVLGDFNAYGMEDPIDEMTADDYADLAATYGSDADSYVFDGYKGSLDYGFGSQAILSRITGAETWNINSPEPDALDYNLDFGRDPSIFDPDVPWRTSDHDPLMIGLDFGDAVA